MKYENSGEEPAPVGVDEADDEAADHRALEAAEATDDHDHQRVREDVPVGARVEREKGSAGDAGEPGEERGESEDEGEQPVHVDAERVHHLAVVDARADEGAELGAGVEKPQDPGDEDAEDDEQEAVARVDDAAGQVDGAARELGGGTRSGLPPQKARQTSAST